ncbi:MAG: DsrE family protein [Gammaproteobacteria bacterium]|nr:DsrE family protein [Gammaproteobacteria bacterium]MBU6508996.1 DsrE family protein [Gammaproteobacteria bacterium]MDE1983805.1 DsrE family protein [Gammaproteobacteria bacterium]MDE2108769.1 DsrE family protein [Gammaproteobacteria bacterium]
MIKTHWLLAVLIGVFLSSAALAAPPPGFWQNPVIKDAGAMHPLPEGAFQPDKTTVYKVVFAVTRAQKKDEPDDGLEPVARAVNVFASAGVPLDHLKFVALISGGATPVTLDNAHYKKQFGVDNPNLKVIHELKAAGVEVVVCGQAVAGFGYQYDWINPDVKVALSALSTSIILQHEGYALMPL